MKKILLITLEYPPQHGGVASYYGGMVEELRRRGNEVTVVSQGLLSKWVWPHWLQGYSTVRAAIKRQKPDYIFVGHVLPLGTIAYALRKRVPYIVFSHGFDVLISQKSWRKKQLVRKILELAKLVVVNSEFTRQEVVKLMEHGNIRTGEQKVIVAYPCPVLLGDVKPDDIEVLRRRLGLVGKKVILTLGRVVERKGHDIVLKALPEILQHVPDVVYVIAGVGPDLGRLGKLVEELKIERAVRFVGEISDEERSAYFVVCDLFVMPSRQIGPDVEGFGIVFLEAAAFGKPSIGGRSGGQGEAILDGQTGALVDPTDIPAFARTAVQLLRDDSLRTELGKNAQARVLYEFKWEKQVEEFINLL